jgi:L-fuculose-phosphate aldolase
LTDMDNIENDLRERLAKVGRQIWDQKLTHGASGNISARIPGKNTCLIKPTGYSFGDLNPEHFIVVDIETRKVMKGDAKPSIETPFHTRLYKLWPEAGGVVHVHPEYCTILSILKQEVVPMGIEIFDAPALANGIPVSKFAPPGTDELADNLVETMKDHVACLMPHHGMTAIGKTIEEAATNARMAEFLAKLHYQVMLVGKPNPLREDVKKTLIEKAKQRGLLV